MTDPSATLGHLSQRVDDLDARLELALGNAVARLRERFQRQERILMGNSPVVRVEQMRQHLLVLSSRAERLLLPRLESAKQEFGANAARLEVLSPLATLSRGYSLTTRLDDATVVSDASLLAIGDRLRVNLRRGAVSCRVEEVELPAGG